MGVNPCFSSIHIRNLQRILHSTIPIKLLCNSYYRDDAKGSEGQRLPKSLNIKISNDILHTTNCTPPTIKGQRILY